MILNHDRSKALHTWGVICTIVAIILIVVGFGLSVFEEDFSLLGAGVCLLIFAPILNGLSVLVEDAEVRLIERSNELLKKKKEKESRPAEQV